MDLRTVGNYAIVYVIWGSTYLAISLAVDDIPPLLMAGMRFLAAGAILYAAGRRVAEKPPAFEWRHAFITGGLMLAVGNGSLSLVETRMPTGVASLIVATVPIWLVVLDAAGRRTWPRRGAVLGLVAGLVGVAMLSREDAGWTGGIDTGYVVLLAAGALAWAAGSLYSRTSTLSSLRLRTGMQMLVGGALLIVMGTLGGERFSYADVGAKAWWALGYLIVFGSLVAYQSYIWLLRNQPAPAVATYAFVNPIVAIGLGVWFLSEPITWLSAAASVLIVGAVFIINTDTRRAVRATGAPAAR